MIIAIALANAVAWMLIVIMILAGFGIGGTN